MTYIIESNLDQLEYLFPEHKEFLDSEREKMKEVDEETQYIALEYLVDLFSGVYFPVERKSKRHYVSKYS